MMTLRDDPLLKDVPEVDGFKVLEPCVLYSKLGEGGMGAVYRGRHLNLDIDVAVKCLRGALADQSVAFVQRFQREARLAAGIHHQNLVQVYDVSQKSGVHYLVMEFVHGETARDRVKRKGRLGLDEALRIALGAATGLGEAHGRKIVHRDVKPDNVLIGRDGSVKVSDLGLAKAIESEVDVSLTQGVMGTPQYMAPEQWEDSSSVTPAADVWALGATIWFLLAGSDPIRKGTLQQVYKAVCVEPFPSLLAARPDVPEAIVQIVERCVAKDPKQRFADCREVRDALRAHVGADRGELVTHPGETTQMGATLVSPPPPATMARIRSHVESRTDFKPELVAATLPLAGTAPEQKATSPKATASTERAAAPLQGGTATGSPVPASAATPQTGGKKRLLLFAAGGAGLVVLVLAALALFNKSPGRDPGSSGRIPAGGAEPRNSPPEETAMRVRILGIPEDAASKSFDSRRFTLTGEIEGKNNGLTPRIRERGGSVKYSKNGQSGFKLDLAFDRDGSYTLEFDGPGLEGLRQVTLVVDGTKPVLLRRSESIEPPIPWGKKVNLRLEFDEAIASAEVAGERADIDGAVATVRVNAPSSGADWSVTWKAVDLVGIEATNRFTIPLVDPDPPKERSAPASAPPQEPPKSEPAKPESAKPVVTNSGSGARALPPPGFIAVGDDTLEIAGRAWPRRVQQEKSGIHFVLVPPGSFTMGSTVVADRAPLPRRVTISKGFYMAEDEVSEAEYARVLGLPAPAGDARLPVGGLTFDDAQKFCTLAELALPREAEWEYACRAGKTTAFAFGDSLDPARFATLGGLVQRRPCGFSPRNEFGLADMHGNMLEYCIDGYLEPAEYAKLPDVDPIGRPNREAVQRGGSYATKVDLCSCAARAHVDRKTARANFGLRPLLRLP